MSVTKPDHEDSSLPLHFLPTKLKTLWRSFQGFHILYVQGNQ